MNKILILFFSGYMFFSCSEKNETKELPKFDKNGTQIVYSEEVYAKMLIKNRNLKVIVIDTFCKNQKAKAIKDVKNGKLIYFGSHQEFKKITKILNQYGIQTKEQLRRCIRFGEFEPYCYEYEMLDEINRKFGENFIDSIIKVAQKESVLENPTVE